MSALPDPAEQVSRLLPRRRARLIVEVDLDPIPGWGNDPEDWVGYIRRTLLDSAPHYHPAVICERVLHQPEVEGEATR